MFNVGVGEMFMLLLVALLVFGPKRLPDIARNMGRFIRNFQQETNRALSDLKQGIEPVTTGIFDEPDPGTATQPTPEQSEAPAAAFGAASPAAPSTRRTTTRARSSPPARRKPVTRGRSATARAVPAKRTGTAKKTTTARKTTKKPAATKSSRRR